MALRVENPYLGVEGYTCFGCCPTNAHGLRMEFWYDEEPDEVWSTVEPSLHHCGYPGILHGGIQATLLDEVGYWAVYWKLRVPAFTTKLDVELLRAIRLPSQVEARARVDEVRRRVAVVSARLLVGGVEHARARIVYYCADAQTWQRVVGRAVPGPLSP